MKKQQGFTLIELVIVIVILGILAVTAAPKFVSMQKDARVSALGGLAGAIKGAGNIVYAKAALSGEEGKGGSNASDKGTVALPAGNVTTNFGYPEATQAALQLAADIPSGDWTFVEGAGSAEAASPAAGTLGISAGGTVDYSVTTANGNSCHVTYTPPGTAGGSPVVSVVSGAC